MASLSQIPHEDKKTDDEVFAALNKTWTRIGMGRVALANSLVGRPLFAPEEIVLLARALIPDDEGKIGGSGNIGVTGS